MQKALIINYDIPMSMKKRDLAQDESLAELNRHLADGWKIVQSYPMSGHAHAGAALSLAIIEKLES